jgi:hypothetical protein
MTTQQIVDHSRSIADMESSKFISATDEANFLNEAYKIIYARYCATGGDYWLSESVHQVDDADAVPNGKGLEWLVTLPIDFYQLRGVSYDIGSQWYPMQRVAYSQRNFPPQRPGYRLRNTKLWILGVNPPNLRIDYYPTPTVWTIGTSEINYPSAELYDILAYEMAASYLRKQTDSVKLPVVEAKVAALWAQWTETIKQDQYQFERIQNQYQNYSNYGW